MFRSALPHGERLSFVMRQTPPMPFRSALPRGERRPSDAASAAVQSFRSALPHGERRPKDLDDLLRLHVSIRAPARGATRRGAPALRPWLLFRSALPHGERPAGGAAGLPVAVVSIRAPARGATRRGAPALRPWLLFRSPLPHGERPAGGAAGLPVAVVSIRAPARGATSRARARFSMQTSFDPRSRTGSDSYSMPLDCSASGFDPRSRTGSDQPPRSGVAAKFPVSIRAPARGATHGQGIALIAAKLFRSALPHGERHRCVGAPSLPHRGFDPRSRTGSDMASRAVQSTIGRFDPRSRTGSDREWATTRPASSLFRSALPHGERPGAYCKSQSAALVSIRAPARGAT